MPKNLLLFVHFIKAKFWIFETQLEFDFYLKIVVVSSPPHSIMKWEKQAKLNRNSAEFSDNAQPKLPFGFQNQKMEQEPPPW